MGLYEKVKGSGVWYISYFDAGGKRHRERIGRKNAAQTELDNRRRAIADGKYLPPRAGSRVRFRHLAQLALNRKKLRLAPRSYETDVQRLGQLLPLIGNVPVDLCTSERIEDALAAIRGRVSASTTNRYRALISSIFKFGIQSGRVKVNPCSGVTGVKPFPENASRVRWLTEKEEAKLRHAFVSHAHEAEFDLALYTGMRRGEQFGLTWANVDFVNEQLHVRGKTGPRVVMLNPDAVAALRRLEETTGGQTYVSPDMHEGVERDFRRWFQDACKKARVANFRWHDIRHTFASRLVMAGADLVSVQGLMGHKNIRMTMRYAHLAPSHLRDAVRKLRAK